MAKRERNQNQDTFIPSAKLNEKQGMADKEYQQFTQGLVQIGEDLDESVIKRSQVLQADLQQKEQQTRAKSGEKKKFKVNPNLKKQIDPEVIKQQLKEEQEALKKQQSEQDQEVDTLVTQKGSSFFGIEKAQPVTTKRKGFHGARISKEEIGDIQNQDDGATELKNYETKQVKKLGLCLYFKCKLLSQVVEGTIEEEDLANTHKPDNMFEPTKLPFQLISQDNKNDEKAKHEILDSKKFNMLQFPSQFVYKLPQNAKTKLKLKKLDVEKLHELKEILSFNAQKPYDSAGNSIKYNYNTIDYFAQKDPKKEQGFNMGKLRIYSDGSVQFICGQNIFDVTEGVQNNCKQQFVAIDQAKHLFENPTIFNVDNINKKFVIQPNINELYKK
ncbi:RNA polymerase III RPC4 protein (macronuclear) [Tetrahymena thermophila SB210]|uniref:RNA polymerase III RPC4 protein n=1 Tax=Tetrahymena thermophila (strain SB210) TaxID=312017 RepID=I7LU91_TETTS|nr:RNA polymerase III RPC4 protein [Tetrahymena thermophila SB210]EAR90832.4 RNA polymerase III RPC4 protein [Tetrahymena thermophila SB210]|eukprot:XP_001011077.4 RNA polymerase III RPC4 protein [Tetrahymena thermophila SB210]